MRNEVAPMAGERSPRTFGERRAARATRALAAVLMVGLAAVGCATEPTQRVGADRSKVGPQSEPPEAASLPTARSTTVYDPNAAAAADGSGAATPSASSGELDRLIAVLTTSLDGDGHPPAHLDVQMQQPSAGNQIAVTWTVADDPTDKRARDRARSDALNVLQAVHESSLDYDSVLLTINASMPDEYGATTIGKAVRAKYSRSLMRSTSLTRLSSEEVFRIADDKPAEIHPLYR
ncbi:hypothetical protein ACWGQ5_02420 [Streptomyces sp. NPDC055722]